MRNEQKLDLMHDCFLHQRIEFLNKKLKCFNRQAHLRKCYNADRGDADQKVNYSQAEPGGQYIQRFHLQRDVANLQFYVLLCCTRAVRLLYPVPSYDGEPKIIIDKTESPEQFSVNN